MEWVILGQFLGYTMLALGGAGLFLRARSLKERQRTFDEATCLMTAAGFSVQPVTEHFVRNSAGGAPEELELKSALRASLGDGLDATVGVASAHEARGLLRRRGLEVVKRATFTIAREGAAGRARRALGVKDIEIGVAAFDAALKISGWPADTVRAIIAQPPVRAGLAAVFQLEWVSELRATASAEQGCLRATWRLPWSELARLRELADVVERLAVALDEARWVEPTGKPDAPPRPSGTAGPSSGAPFAIPGSGDTRPPRA